MKTYPITNNTAETIEFKAEETGDKSSDSNRFALVQRVKGFTRNYDKIIIMNRNEVLKLYQAIQDEVLNKKGE